MWSRWATVSTTGSSPRVRGTFFNVIQDPVLVRFIPACAGNIVCAFCAQRSQPVHPRVCGEHFSKLNLTACKAGSSPRVRGTFQLVVDPPPLGRFIPACAGNMPAPAHPLGTAPVHPRVCGEHGRRKCLRPTATGSSPRVRGTLIGYHHSGQGRRFIPACAGKHRQNEPRSLYLHGSSPRVRGTFRAR